MTVVNTENFTLEEAVEELNDFDDKAIEKNFGVTEMDAERNPYTYFRGVIWIIEHRKDNTFTVKKARELTKGEVRRYFPELKGDPKPETDVEGKDESDEN